MEIPVQDEEEDINMKMVLQVVVRFRRYHKNRENPRGDEDRKLTLPLQLPWGKTETCLEKTYPISSTVCMFFNFRVFQFSSSYEKLVPLFLGLSLMARPVLAWLGLFLQSSTILNNRLFGIWQFEARASFGMGFSLNIGFFYSCPSSFNVCFLWNF